MASKRRDPGNDLDAHAIPVPLTEIDQTDERFQVRLEASIGELRRSIEANGQAVPVVLWGQSPPYSIVDGFRRTMAVGELGWTHVRALVRSDLTERQAFCLAFLENAKRKGLSSWDKASAIWRAHHDQGMPKDEIASELSVSVRQVDRYLELFDLSTALREALRDGGLTMAQAAVLHRHGPKDPSEWIASVRKERLSASRLRRRLARPRKGRPPTYIQCDADGFRMYPFRYHPSLSPAERLRLATALDQALAIVRGT